MEKLTTYEKRIARAYGITAADVHQDGRNSCGTVYALYNPCYYTRITFYGSYTRTQIYRVLLRKFINQLGITAQ